MRRLLLISMSILMALAICSASGAHWILLQSVAWMGMVAAYAQDRPLKQAVADALDGRHPCDVCKIIVNGSQQEKKSPSGALPGAHGKVLLYFVPDHLGLVPVSQRTAFVRERLLSVARRDAPPLPPPRVG